VPGGAQPSGPPQGTTVSFTLRAADGNAISERTYRGKWPVVYFGYTSCPDLCPTTLMEIAGALEKLGPRARLLSGATSARWCQAATASPAQTLSAVLTDHHG
jgi:cytochrome oxidase Cu insertion factor (SCO1/SenC/PrrC family)